MPSSFAPIVFFSSSHYRRLHWFPSVLLLLAAGLAFSCGGSDDRSGRNLRAAPGLEDAVLTGPAGPLSEALLDPRPLQRAARVALILDSLPPAAVPDVRQAYDTTVLDLGDIEMVLLAEWWSSFDPAAAFQWTRKEWVGDHPRVVLAVLRAWARQDPETAMAEAMKYNGSAVGDVYIGAAASGWAESGEPGLMEFVEGLPVSGTRQRALTAVIRLRILQEGPEAMMEWAENLPIDTNRFKTHSVRRVASAIAEIDPKLAAEFAERNSIDGSVSKLYSRVGSVWARSDPEAAMAWIGTLPESRDASDASGEAFRVWLQADRPAASAWIQGVKLEPSLDGAVGTYARSLSLSDTEAALEWAQRVSNEELRWPTVGSIARFWYQDDPEAAQAWIAAHPELPDLYKQKAVQVPAGMKRRHARFREKNPLPAAQPAGQ